MVLDLDPIVATNLILAASILILGVWIYERRKETLALFVAAGFGLFAVSHALTFLGYGDLQTVIIPIRALGYLAVIAGLIVLLLRTARVSKRGEPKPVESRQAVS